MNKKITLLKGDGIGPEIINETVKVLESIGEKFGHTFVFTEADIGGCSIDKYGVPITDEAIEMCKNSDSVLLGAVGGPKWDNVESSIRPEKALLKIRKELGVFANLRPTKLFPCLSGASPLKNIQIENPLDFIIVRELTGGIYFGRHETGVNGREEYAKDEMTYTESEIERIARVGFETAMKRNKKLASVDKANVLDTSKLWRKVLHRVKEDYPEVEYSDILVDNAAMQLIKDPYQFDVIVTENMFGDILSDEASMLTGSIGMMPSASLSDTSCGLYEPIHGSAPDIAGDNKANPIGAILSGAMMLRFSFNMQKEADAIEEAVKKVIEKGYRTQDISDADSIVCTCSKMGDIIKEHII